MSWKKTIRTLYRYWAPSYDVVRGWWTNIFSYRAEKMFTRILKRHTSKNSSILELGCGTGYNLRRFATNNIQFGQYLGVDFSPDMQRQAKSFTDKRLRFRKADIANFRPTKKYNVIVSTWVLSHLKNPSTVINRFSSQHLTKGGVMLLLYLSRPKWWVALWLLPLMSLFGSKPVAQSETRRMKGIVFVKKYLSDGITMVLIRK